MPWPRGFFPGRWGSMRCRGEACLAPTRVGVGVGHARPEALRNKSDGHGTRGMIDAALIFAEGAVSEFLSANPEFCPELLPSFAG